MRYCHKGTLCIRGFFSLDFNAQKVQFSNKKDHRMVWVGRNLKDHQAPISLPQTGPPTSISNTKPGCPIQADLEHLQGDGIYNLPGQPVPVPHHSLCGKLLPDILPKSSLLQLKTVSPCPVIIYPCKELTLLLFVGFIKKQCLFRKTQPFAVIILAQTEEKLFLKL